MNKKSILFASVAVFAGISTSIIPVSAFEDIRPNGAIIRQLQVDDNEGFIQIGDEFNPDGKDISEERIFDEKMALYRYYEKIANFQQADNTFFELLDIAKNTEDPEQKEAKLSQLKGYTTYLHKCSPTNSVYLYRLSLIDIALKDYDSAEGNIRKALIYSKNSPFLISILVDIYRERKDYNKLVKLFERAKKEMPSVGWVRVDLAQAYAQAGKYDEAIREYQTAALLDPERDEIVVAMNELMPYSSKYNNGQFYDPMTTVKPDLQNGNTSAFSVQEPLETSDKEIKVSSKIPVAKKNKKSAPLKNAKPNRAIQSSKRAIVTYVNGKKVVKIVNINSDASSAQNLKEASSTFESQLAELNTGYDNSTLSSENGIKPVSNISKGSFSKSKYQVNDKDYISGNSSNYDDETAVQRRIQQISETNEYGDPNVGALMNNSGRKQLVVSYKNGKKVVQMVSPDGTISNQSASDKKQKNKQDKKINKSQKQSQTFQDNTNLYIKANEYLAQEQYQAAIEVLKNVQPATLRSLTAIASCYNSLGQTNTAIEYYLQADKLSPNNTQILYSVAYLYFSKNDVSLANKYIDLALKADPANQNALQLKQYMSQNVSNEAANKAVSYMNQGNYSESKKLLEKSLRDNPNDFQSYYYLGHVSYATQKYEDAVRNFVQAIRLNPDYALSYYSIGLAYDKLKEFNKSIVAYQQFLQLEADDNKYTQYAKTRINTIKSKQ